MLTYQKKNGILTLKLTFSQGGSKLVSNARPNLTQQILFGVTEGNNAAGSRLKVRKIYARGDGELAEFRQMAKEIIEEVGIQGKTQTS